jgi:hypothetical protein
VHNDTQHDDQLRHALCQLSRSWSYIVMLSVIILNVDMLSVVALNLILVSQFISTVETSKTQC